VKGGAAATASDWHSLCEQVADVGARLKFRILGPITARKSAPPLGCADYDDYSPCLTATGTDVTTSRLQDAKVTTTVKWVSVHYPVSKDNPRSASLEG
jgi:hypothetical protein